MTKKKPEKNTPVVNKAGEPDPLDIGKKDELKKDNSVKTSTPFKAFAPSKGQMNFIALFSIVMGSQKGLLAMIYTLSGLIALFYTF